MDHQTKIDGFADLAQLAEAIGDLRYDALAAFLAALSAKLAKDGAADAGRGRSRLATSLNDASTACAVAGTHIQKAWCISAPFMLNTEE